MVDKLIFLFPGQGSQAPGMAMDLHAASPAVRTLFERAKAATGTDYVDLLTNADAETLKRTDVAQPAITLANLAAGALLAERGLVPAACAGHSLGEYAALASAGVIAFEDCMRLVAARGRAMQDAADALAQNGDGEAPGMAAVLGLSPTRVEELITLWKEEGLKDLFAANLNAAGQVVVSGTAEALAACESRFKEAGAKRVIRLKVAGPFHSPLIASAAKAFEATLETINFNNPAIPLFSNVSGKQIQSGAEAKKFALRQITEGVRWTDEEAAIAAFIGTDAARALEVGPGKVLQGLWKDANPSIPCLAAGTCADIDALTGGNHAS